MIAVTTGTARLVSEKTSFDHRGKSTVVRSYNVPTRHLQFFRYMMKRCGAVVLLSSPTALAGDEYLVTVSFPKEASVTE